LHIFRYKQDKDIDIDIDIDKYIDINIMYKYIIFFGVMFHNPRSEALRGRELGLGAGSWCWVWELGLGEEMGCWG
jgi:hypothetical protein